MNCTGLPTTAVTFATEAIRCIAAQASRDVAVQAHHDDAAQACGGGRQGGGSRA